MKQLLLLMLSVLLLLCGFLTYYFFRPEVVAVSMLHSFVPLPQYRLPGTWNRSVVQALAGHLPDICWYASLLLAGMCCLPQTGSRRFALLFATAPLMLELLQGVHMIPGTFDWWDILDYSLTLLLLYILFAILKSSLMTRTYGTYAFPAGLLIAFVAFALASAPSNQVHYTTGTLRFAPRTDDDYTNPELISYLKSTPNPTIVLRVPNQVGSVVQANENSQIYNTIEKELAENNFVVRDRALFQKVLDENSSSDYSKIYQLTHTDLILELVSFNEKVPYNTNQYQDRRGRQRIFPVNLSVPGIRVEFKLIQVKDNQLVGDYTFNYAPCTNGCLYTFDNLGNLYNPNNLKKKITTPYDYITQDQMELFFQTCTKHLISELRMTAHS